MTRLRITKLLRCCFFGLVVSLATSEIGVKSSDEISEAPHILPSEDSREDYSSNEASYESQYLAGLDLTQMDETESSISVDGYGSFGVWGGASSSFESPFYNPFVFEFEQRQKLTCQEKFCVKALYGRRSSKLFKSYIESVMRSYILESKLRSWFFRLWSGSTVLTSPVLYIGRRLEFREVYKSAKKNYRKLKDSAVVVILKVMTKRVSRELALEEEEEASRSGSVEDGQDSSPRDRAGGRDDSSGEASSCITQAVKNLCIKLRGLSKHRGSDNGRSYLFVVEADGITDRLIFSRLMTSLIQTSCWNRANMDKSRVIVPVVVGDFKYVKEEERGGGILSDVYGAESGSGGSSRSKSKSRSSGSRPKSEPPSGDPVTHHPGPESERDQEEFGEGADDSADFGAEYNALFVKWLKRCNESKVIYEKYETTSPGLFEKLLTQYLVYAVNDRVVAREISKGGGDHGYRSFMSEYPRNCYDSWNELLSLVESEYRESSIGFKIMLIGTLLESLHVANNTLFKEDDKDSDQKEKQDLLSRMDKDPETCELYSMLSSRDQSPVTLQQARLMDDLLVRLRDLPDRRRSRLDFKKYLSSGLSVGKESGTQVLELFEAVDHIQRSFHLVRAMYITSAELGLTVNPLEILISVCRNAKLVPAEDSQGASKRNGSRGSRASRRESKSRTDLADASKREELEESSQTEDGYRDGDGDGDGDAMEECNPFNYLSEDLLSEEFEGDVMEYVQKSSIRFASLLLGLVQYNTRILSLHVSNLVIKVERLILSNVLEGQKVSSMTLVLAEKVLTFSFSTLPSFSYLREVSETRTASLLRPFIPLYPSYTLMGLYGDSVEIGDRRHVGRVLVMEICMLYYDPKSLLETEFVNLCVATWESGGKEDQDYYFKSISQASSRCKKLSWRGGDGKESEADNDGTGNGKNHLSKAVGAGGRTSPTVFLFCDLLEKLVNGPGSRSSQAFAEARERYLPRGFESQCDKIKSYSIQQSGNLYNMLVKLYKKQ